MYTHYIPIILLLYTNYTIVVTYMYIYIYIYTHYILIILICEHEYSDGSIEFDPAPDDEDGTFEINQAPPDSKTGQFYLETALVGRLPASKKANLTVILQGQKQPIKRSIAVQVCVCV